MANNLIEEQILKGRGRISLLADGHDIEEINESLETIEKKNPSLAEDNIGATAPYPADDSGSTLEAGSSGSSSTSEPTTRVGRFFAEPQMDQEEESIPLPTPMDTSLRKEIPGLPDSTPRTLEGVLQDKFGDDPNLDLSSPEKTLEAAARLTPEEADYFYSSFLDLAFQLRLNEDQEYQNRLAKINGEIADVEERLKANNYRNDDIVRGAWASPYTQNAFYQGAWTAVDKRNQDEQLKESLKLDRDLMITTTKARMLADDVEEAYRLVTKEPEKYQSIPVHKWPISLINKSRKDVETKEWLDWASKMHSIEEDVYNNGQGLLLDIDQDGYVGYPSKARDFGVSVGLAVLTAFDMIVYVQEAVVEGGIDIGGQLVGDPRTGRTLKDVYRDNEVEYSPFNWYAKRSTEIRNELNAKKSVEINPWEEQYLMGEAGILDGLVNYENVLSMVESSPYFAVAAGTFAVTKDPLISAGAMATVSSAVELHYAKQNAAFDTFYVGGEKLDPVKDADKLKEIQANYDEGLRPMNGDVIYLSDGTQVKVETNDIMRYGYSFGQGVAEAVPEVVGLGLLAKFSRSFKGGAKSPLKNYIRGLFASAGFGMTEEGLEEAATAVSSAWLDQQFLNEQLSPKEYVMRVVRETGAGMMGGFFLGPTMYGGYKAKELYDIGGGIPGTTGFADRIRRGFEANAMIYDAYASGKFGIPSESVEKAAEKVEKLRKEKADPEFIREAEAKLREELLKNSSDKEQNAKLLDDLFNAGLTDEAIKIMALAHDLRVAKEMGPRPLDSRTVSLLPDVNQLKTDLDNAIKEARKALEGQVRSTENLDEFEAQALTIATEATEAMESWVDEFGDQIASELGTTKEDVKNFLLGPGRGGFATLGSAMTAAKETGGTVKIFGSLDEYVEAVPEGKRADRRRSLAQFVPVENADGTTSFEIHLSPNASVADVFEEVIHSDIKKEGYSEEELEAMAKELLEHENENVKRVAKDANETYDGDPEEIVAQVLRENINAKYENAGLQKLSKSISKNYGETQLNQILFDRKPSDLAQAIREYRQLERMMVTAGINDLARRTSSIESLNSKKFIDAVDELGFDLNSMTFDQLDELEKHLNAQPGIDMWSLGSVSSSKLNVRNPNKAYKFEDPQMYKALRAIKLPNGQSLLTEAGYLRDNLAVILMRLDNTGNLELEFQGKKIKIKGGVDMEKEMSMDPSKPVLIASTNAATASRFERALRELAGDYGYVMALYAPMGQDAVKTSETYFTYALNDIYNSLAQGGKRTKNVGSALVSALSGYANDAVRWSVQWRDEVYSKDGKKKTVGRTKFFDTQEEALAHRDELIKESNASREAAQGVEKPKDTIWVLPDENNELGYNFIIRDGKQSNAGFFYALSELEKAIERGKGTEIANRVQEVLKGLIDNEKIYRSAWINKDVRKDIIASLEKSLGLDINKYLEAVSSEAFTDKDGNIIPIKDYEQKISHLMIGQLAPLTEDKDATYIDVFSGERTQYEVGIPFLPGTVTFEQFVDESGNPRFLDPAMFFDEAKLNKPKAYQNEIIEKFIMSERVKPEGQEKESRLRVGSVLLPEGKFTMNWYEIKNVGHKGTRTEYVSHEKEFNDGWHFWNWWVWYTGNADPATMRKVSGWYFRDENLDRMYLEADKIPKKRPEKYQWKEPGYKSWEQKSLEKNMRLKEQATLKAIKDEQEYDEAKRQLDIKLGDTKLTYNLLDQYVGPSREFAVDNSFYARRSADYVRTAEKLGDIMLGINEMSEGDITSWYPKTYDLANNSLDAYSKDHTLVEVAFKEIQGDRATIHDVRGWLQRYARFENETDALVHTVQKTADGFRVSVGLNVHNSVIDELGQAYDFSKGYRSFHEMQDLIYDSQNGVYGEPRDYTEEKSSRILPNRYYDLKGQIGAWPAFSKWAYGFFVNDKKPILDIQQEILDEYGAIPQEYNFEEIEQLMYGRTRFAMENLDEKMQTAKTFMLDNNISHIDLSQFMYALHAQERNKKIMKTRPDMENGSGMYSEDAAEIIRQLDSPKMRQAAKFFYDILDDTRETMLEYGLETPERIAAWTDMYQNYVPLQGFAEDEMDPNTNTYPSGGAGMGIFGSKVRAAYGRESEAANVLANIIMQNALVHQQAEKNRVVTSLHGLFSAFDTDQATIVNMETPLTKIDQNGDQVAMTMLEMQADPHTVPVRINGKQEFVWFKDPYYAQLLNGATKEEMNTFMRVMRIPVQFLRGVYTQWNPEFFVPNFSRDIHGAVYNASSDLEQGKLEGVEMKGFKREMVSNTFSTLKVLLNEAALGREMEPEMQGWYSEWKEDGGQTGWNYIKDISQIMNELSTDSSDLSAGQKAGAKIFESAQSTLQFVEGVNDAFENSIRLSAYITARKRGASRQQAAVFSKNITVNFNRQGEAGPAINTMYLFFNAAVQGTARTGRSLITPKTIVDENGKETKVMSDTQKIAAWMAGFSAMLTMVNLAVSGDDPDDGVSWYDKIPDYEKQRNMIICYGPNRDDFIKIPLPYGFNLVNNVGSTTVEAATGHRSIDEALMFMAGSTISSTSPITIGGDPSDPVDMAIRTTAPTVAQVPLDIAMNKSSFSGAPVTKTQSPYGPPKPESEMMMRSPEWLQQIARDLNYETGGSEFVPGTVDINFDPMVYALDQYGGGPLSIITDMFNITEQVVANVGAGVENAIDNRSIRELAVNPLENIKAKDIPIAGVTSTEASEYYDFNEFYDNRDIVEQLYKELREVQETGQVIQEEPGRYNGIQILKEQLKETDKQLKQIREKEREIQSTLYDAENFVEFQNNLIKLTELREAKRRLMARWNKQYNSYR